ncbi:MAG: hypothetical protein ACREV6_02050 [Clostridium sp.]|uniref:hypothetical protein n=1 Tax=Clostridium sp. TaxID=1506 RepID=UPI003D6D8027
MATYKQIQKYVKETHGFIPKTCWIAHMKEVLGLESKVAFNRINIDKRTNPRPEDKQKYIGEAFRHFNMVG